jgi:hypothetical protein
MGCGGALDGPGEAQVGASRCDPTPGARTAAYGFLKGPGDAYHEDRRRAAHMRGHRART